MSTLRQSIIVVACLALGSATSAIQAQSEAKSKSADRRTLVVLIGGMDSDPTPSQIAGTAGRGGNSGLYRLMGDIRHEQIDTDYFNWNGTRAGQIKSKPQADFTEIVDTIRSHVNKHRRSRVVIVGNSWGGHTAWEVCRSLVESPEPIAIDYVVFLDPSSSGRAETSRPKQLPININRATNYYTRNLFVWRRWPREPRLENIDLGDPNSGYLTPRRAAYDSAFDFQAHVAAEWDEKIHASIKRQIMNLVQGVPQVASPQTPQAGPPQDEVARPEK